MHVHRVSSSRNCGALKSPKHLDYEAAPKKIVESLDHHRGFANDSISSFDRPAIAELCLKTEALMWRM